MGHGPAQSPDDPMDMDMKIYADVAQTGGVTDASPNGDFTMNFSQHADGDSEFFVMVSHSAGILKRAVEALNLKIWLQLRK